MESDAGLGWSCLLLGFTQGYTLCQTTLVTPLSDPSKRHRLTEVTRSFVLDNGFRSRSQQSFSAHTCPPGSVPGTSPSLPLAWGLSQR